MKKLVFCDIDGCLNYGKNTPLDLPVLAEIKAIIPRLAATGIGFTLCTGRPQPYAEAIAQILVVDLPLVCEGGAMVYEPRGDKYRPMASAESLRSLNALQAAIQASGILHDDFFFEIGNACSLCLTGPAIAERDQVGIRAEMDRLIAMYADYPVSWSHSTTSVDITPQNVSKGSGVRAICADYGIELKNTFGIGDSNGDISMFKVVGERYCPSNANDELKAIAHHVSTKDHAGGTLDILQKIIREA
jgi:hydroxymethylpyrimidine pyrophosphatase-like HAD family hydrolase